MDTAVLMFRGNMADTDGITIVCGFVGIESTAVCLKSVTVGLVQLAYQILKGPITQS